MITAHKNTHSVPELRLLNSGRMISSTPIKPPTMPIQPVGIFMRHTALYDTAAGRDTAVSAIQGALGQFENLFRNLGDVVNGFPKRIPLEELVDREQYNPDMLEANLMFGSPDEVIAKLKSYEALGVDEFIYYASMGLGHKEQKHSLDLFCSEVMPAFA